MERNEKNMRRKKRSRREEGSIIHFLHLESRSSASLTDFVSLVFVNTKHAIKEEEEEAPEDKSPTIIVLNLDNVSC